MSKLRVNSFSISIDGYGAGPGQSLKHPFGVGGLALNEWLLATKTGQTMSGNSGGTTGVDDDFAARGLSNIGAWILGRNMFGPIRGPWPDDSWKGWWGNVPPYHTPVFVLTKHARKSITMDGGTTFHFVTEGIHAALERARDAAKEQDVRVGGGVATIRQYLQAGLIDGSSSRSARYCSAPANTFSPTSTRWHLVTSAAHTSQRQVRRTSF